MLTTSERRALATDIAGDLSVAFAGHARQFVDERFGLIVDVCAEYGLDPEDVVDDIGRQVVREGRRIRALVRRSRRRGRR